MINDRSTAYKKGKLLAKPAFNFSGEINKGIQSLNRENNRDCVYYIPSNYSPENPATLVLMFHGAGGQADHGLSYLRKYADEHNMIIVSPASQGRSWDIIIDDEFGKDVSFIDSTLSYIFTHYNIDPNKICIGGFSDGASYALCLGLTNGNLFTHILAFSPGFFSVEATKGKPEIFISHGIEDHVLPIHACSRRILPQLESKGYAILYKEFEGEHEIPYLISEAAMEWLFATK